MRAITIATVIAALQPVQGVVQCPDHPTDGCSPPQWPVRYDMAGSTYTYCFGTCPLPWLAQHQGLGNVWNGIVGYDHYYTNQGMPCVGGRPQEFEHQDAITNWTKTTFPGSRVLQYRITGAVPYAGIVHDLMLTNPEYFIQWNNGSICQMPYAEHGTGQPGDNCSWPIIASAYDFSQTVVQDWFLQNIIMPTLKFADGTWLDGDGPDNGAWMCSGSYDYPNLPAPYPPINATQIAAFCAGEGAVAIAAQKALIAAGGFEYECFRFVDTGLPAPDDNATTCAAKLQALDHKPTAPAVVLYGDRTSNHGYDDSTAAQAVATFLLTRGDYWYLSMQPGNNTLDPATAALMLTDYGAPLGNMSMTSPGIYSRSYEKMVVSLNCNNFTASFVPPPA